MGKHFLNNTDNVFLSETHCNIKSMKECPGFTVIGDPSFPIFQRHGGLSVYIKDIFTVHEGQSF